MQCFHHEVIDSFKNTSFSLDCLARGIKAFSVCLLFSQHKCNLQSALSVEKLGLYRCAFIIHYSIAETTECNVPIIYCMETKPITDKNN